MDFGELFTLEKIAENITLYLLVLVGAIVFLYFLGGLIIGRRRSIYRWITTIIYYTLLIVFADKLINFAITFDLTKLSFLGIDFASMGGTTILEIMQAKITGVPEETYAIAISFASILVKYLLFTIVSIIIAIPYCLLTWLIFIIFFKKRKKKVTEEYQDKKTGETKTRTVKKKPRKHAGAGALINAFRGLTLSALFVVILFNGPIGIIPQGLDQLVQNSESEDLAGGNPVDSLNSEQAQLVLKLIYNYQESPFYKFGQIGGEGKTLNDLVNKTVWTVNINGEKIDFRQDLISLTSIVPDALDLMSSDLNDPLSLDYGKVGNIVSAVAKTKSIPALLPVLVDMAKESADIVNKLNQIGITPEDLNQIDIQNDLDGIVQVLNNSGEIAKNIRFEENEENLKTLDYLDLSSLDGDLLKNTIQIISSLSIVNIATKVVVKYARENEQVNQYIQDLEINLDDIVFGDELVNLVDVANAFIDTGITSINYIKNNLNAYIGGLDFGSSEYDNGVVGKLLTTLFASSLISEVFPKVMEKIVYPKLPDNIQSLFDFSVFSDIFAWENEFQSFIGIVKEIKGNETVIFDENNKFNFNLINNLSARSILNSTLVSQALINLLTDSESILMQNAGSYIQFPDVYKNANYEGWKSEEVYKYQAIEDVTLADGKIEKFTTVAPSTYSSLNDELQAKFRPIKHVVGGEIYRIIDGIMEVKNAVNIGLLVEGKANDLMTVENIKTVVDNGGIDKLLESDIVRCSLSKLVKDMGGEQIIIPSTACDTETIGGVETKIIKTSEYKTILNAAVKLDVAYTEYQRNDLPYPPQPDDPVYDGLSVEQYNALSDEDKALYSPHIILKIQPSQLLSTLNETDSEGHSKLDYVLGNEEAGIQTSQILQATASKFLFDMSDTIVILESDCEQLGDVTVIKASEMRKAVNAIANLDIIDDNGEIKVDLTLINTLNDQVDDNHTKLDYVLDSDIIVATLSKYVFETDNDMLVVPSTTYTMRQKHAATPTEVKVLNEEELRSIVDMAITLNIVGSDGNISVDISVINKLKGVENNSDILKATITKYVLEQDGTLSIPTTAYTVKGGVNILTNEEYNGLVNAIVDLGLVNEQGEVNADISLVNKLYSVNVTSLIIKATIAKYVLEQDATLAIPTNSYEAVGGVNMLTNSEYTQLINAIHDLEIVDNSGNINADITLINKLKNSNNSSLIIRATVSKYILEQSSTLSIPSTVHSVSYGCDMIEVNEYHNFINNLVDLEIIDSSGNVNADVSIINRINGNIDSLIMNATISKYVIAQDGTITIPTNSYEAVGGVNVLTNAEFNGFITDVKALNVIDNNGNINASITLINNLKGVNLSSNIMKATITTHILANDTVLVIPSDTHTTIGGKEILTNAELTNLINAIVDLGIVDNSGNVNADLTLLDTISTKDIDVSSSEIIHATITKKIIDADALIIPTELNIITNSVKYIEPTQLNTLIRSISKLGLISDTGNVRNINNLTSDILANANDEQTAINNSAILRATITDKVDDALTITEDSTDSAYTSVNVLTSTELSALFNALDLLGMTDFSSTNITIGKLFELLDNDKLDDLLESKLIWSKASKSILDGAIMIPLSAKSKQLCYISEINENSTIYPTSYAYANSITTGLFRTYAYEQNLTENRLTVSEIIKMVKVFEELNRDSNNQVDYTVTSFNFDGSSFANMYKKPDVFAPLICDSIVLLKSLNNMLNHAIDAALDDTLETYKVDALARVADINNVDVCLYKNYNINTEFDYNNKYGLNDNQLYRLFAALNAIDGKSLSNMDQLSQYEIEAIDDSYILRVLFNNNPVICYYTVTTQFTSGTRTYNVNEYLNAMDYVEVVSNNPSNMAKLSGPTTYPINDTATRKTFINNYVSTFA